MTLIALSIISACSNSEGATNSEKTESGDFTVENISTSSLASGEKYFFVIPFEWSGKEPAEINSIELLDNNEPITPESGISYTFYGGNSDKKTGVYQRETIGEKEEIKGFEIKDKATLILETTLTNVDTNENRKIKINYQINGQEKEQIITSSTFKNLNTEK